MWARRKNDGLDTPPRWHLYFVPTYSSWLNLVERFFALITGRVIRRGSFRSVHELIQRIDHFVANHNTDCKPFIWTATADSILAKLQRLSMRISRTAHSYGRNSRQDASVSWDVKSIR